ncbi:MAG: AAA family ATPase, partial [Acidobacteria bacterium]|nr:AAA family ATPase [Acidobacteriota bacterium]
FKNTVIIMTSNIGSQYLLEGVDADGQVKEGVREAVDREMRAHFRPEFLNRVDDIIFFTPLTLGEIRKIVVLLTDELRQRLADRGIALEISDAAVEMAAREGYDPVYGARPLKRFLQRQLETRIGRAVIAGEVGEGATVRVDVREGAFDVTVEAAVVVAEAETPVAVVPEPAG